MHHVVFPPYSQTKHSPLYSSLLDYILTRYVAIQQNLILARKPWILPRQLYKVISLNDDAFHSLDSDVFASQKKNLMKNTHNPRSHLMSSSKSWWYRHPSLECVTDFKLIKGFKFTTDQFTELHRMEFSWPNAQVEQILADEQTHWTVIIFQTSCANDGNWRSKVRGEDPQNLLSPRSDRWVMLGTIRQSRFGLLDILIFWSCDMVKKGVRVVSNQRGYFEGRQKMESWTRSEAILSRMCIRLNLMV